MQTSLDVSLNLLFSAKLDGLGRLDRFSAYHWAIDDRYVSSLVRVEEFRHSSLVMVMGERPGKG